MYQYTYIDTRNRKEVCYQVKVSVCIGSSCHLKGSYKILESLKEKIKENNLENEVELSGNFCMGKCNLSGVSLQINDKIHTGITYENLDSFFSENILDVIEQGRNEQL